LSQAEIVHLSSDDTLASIRERLRATQGNRILLVVPKDCPGLDSLVDLKILSRQVAAMGKEVALVASSRELRELARSLGFRAFSSTAWARRTKWRPPKRGAQAALRAPLTRESVGRAIPAPASARGIGIGGPAILAIAFTGMVSFMLLLAGLLVPTAKVTLHPLIYPVSATLEVEANPSLESIDFIGVRVPARVVELEVVGNNKIATTAVRDEPEARALGEVVFTNRRSEATTVISDTIVTTSGGTTIRFRTSQEVTIPPGLGSRARAQVEAIEPGPSGNVPAYSINRVEGPMDRQVNVINAEPTAGGGVSQVTYVTSADKEQLSESTLHQLKEDGYSALVAGLAEQEILPRESLEGFVLSETYDKFPGEVADSLELHMRALVRGTVIDRDDVELLGLRMLQFEVREGFQLVSDATEVRLDEVTDVAYDGTMTFRITAVGLSWVEINELDIKESLRGKSVAEAEEYLTRHLSLAEDPTMEVSPDWWGRLPWLPFQISVEVVS
jgi:hypothetical protein